MSKMPFKITSSDAGIGRLPDGKFAKRFVGPTPVELYRKADASGEDMTKLMQDPANRAADHPSVGGKPGAPQSPPLPMAPVRPPFRITSKR